MNELFVLILISPLIISCDTNTVRNNNNPNIPNYSFNIEINLNLPSNTSLQFASNHITNSTIGARGIVVFNKSYR